MHLFDAKHNSPASPDGYSHIMLDRLTKAQSPLWLFSERAARMLLAVRDVMDGIPAPLALAVHVRPDGALHILAAALVGDAADARGEVVHATRLMPPIIGDPDDLTRLLHTLEGTRPPTGLMWPALVGRIAHMACHHLGRFGLAVMISEQQEAARGNQHAMKEAISKGEAAR